MLLEIPGILKSAEAAGIVAKLSRAQFVDGKLSAGGFAGAVKNNLEMAPNQEMMTLARQVYAGLAGHPVFNTFALPRKMLVPIFSRYDVGMEYGLHTDIAMMGIDQPEKATRTDLSFTLFLSEPGTYEGGELVIRTHVGENRFKPAAGSVVVYPSHNLHYVAPVESGVRYAAVSWAQSFVREDSRREILFELNGVAEGLAEKLEAGSPLTRDETDVLFGLYHKLMRMWADT